MEKSEILKVLSTQEPDNNVAKIEEMRCPKKLKELYISIDKNIRANDAVNAMKNLDEVLEFKEMNTYEKFVKSDKSDESDDFASTWRKRWGRKIHSMSRFTWLEITHVWHLLDTVSITALVDTIKSFKDFKNLKILEIGAGMGFLAYFLRHFGINMIATDSYSELKDLTPYTEVLKMNYETALKTYNADVLIVSWGRSRIPFKLFRGKYYIYIGEEPGGCTTGYPGADYDSDKIEDSESCSWEIIKQIEMPCFYGLNDENILIFERN